MLMNLNSVPKDRFGALKGKNKEGHFKHMHTHTHTHTKWQRLKGVIV